MIKNTLHMSQVNKLVVVQIYLVMQTKPVSVDKL